jgi:hypothetical protein
MTNLELTHELWTDRPSGYCPHVRHDEHGCYCKSPSLPDVADPYSACDVYALQIWCLNADHYTVCHFWPPGDTP